MTSKVITCHLIVDNDVTEQDGKGANSKLVTKNGIQSDFLFGPSTAYPAADISVCTVTNTSDLSGKISLEDFSAGESRQRELDWKIGILGALRKIRENKTTLVAELEIGYPESSRHIIISDDLWEYTPGPPCPVPIYHRQKLDSNYEIPDWSMLVQHRKTAGADRASGFLSVR